MDQEFYVYVSSENTPESKIKSIAVNKLPLTIDTVNKQWEVSLVNSAISINWLNVTNAAFEISKLYDEGTRKEIIKASLPSRRYTKTAKLYDALNLAIIEQLPEGESIRTWYSLSNNCFLLQPKVII